MDWAVTLGILGGIAVLGLVFWAVRSGSRPNIVAAMVGTGLGLGGGLLIHQQANQPGIASINGFFVSALLAVGVAAVVILGIVSTRRRTVAFLVAGTMVAGAVASSQLLVAATRA